MLARPALTALLIAGVTLGPAAARAPAADDLVYRCGPGRGRHRLRALLKVPRTPPLVSKVVTVRVR